MVYVGTMVGLLTTSASCLMRCLTTDICASSADVGTYTVSAALPRQSTALLRAQQPLVGHRTQLPLPLVRRRASSSATMSQCSPGAARPDLTRPRDGYCRMPPWCTPGFASPIFFILSTKTRTVCWRRRIVLTGVEWRCWNEKDQWIM